MGHKKTSIENRLIANINVRVTVGIVQEASQAVSNKLVDSESEFYRTAILYGSKVLALKKIQSDPDKRKEFDEKLQALLSMNDVEKTLNTMTEDDLKTVEFMAKNLREKKTAQMILDLKSF